MKRTRVLAIIIPVFFVLIMLAYAKAKSSQPLPAKAATVKPAAAMNPALTAALRIPRPAPTPPDIENVIGLGAGRGAGSLSLDGSGSYVLVPNSPSLDLTGSLTVEAWIKTNSITPESIVERGRWNGDVDGGYALRLSEEGKIQFYTIRSSNDNDFVTGDTVVNPGEWHHVAGVFDGAQLRVYLDGALDGSKASLINPASGTSDLRIGAGADGDGYFFDGIIDNARVTAGVRYAHDFTPDREPLDCSIDVENTGTGCRGVWLFSEENADDSSGFENHGAFHGKDKVFSSETNAELGEIVQPESAGPSAATGDQWINFDELDVHTTVNNAYPDIKFNAETFNTVWTHNAIDVHALGGTLPRVIGPATSFNLSMEVNFPRAVDNLRFNIQGQDDFGTICVVDVYRDNQFAASRPVNGVGRTNQAIPINVGSEFNHVTRVVIRNITDTAGIAYDDFRFTIPAPIPPPPTNLVANALSFQISLNWNGSSGATGYKVKRATTAGGPFATIATVGTPGFFDTSAQKGVTYFYFVSAVNAAGLESANSNQASATIPNPKPEPPPNLFAEANKLKVAMIWGAASGAETYRVKRRASFDSVFTTIASGLTELHYEDFSATPDIQYFYYVVGVNSAGESLPSNLVEASLVPSCGEYLEPRPEPRFYPNRGNGWSMRATVSDRDGVVLTDVDLNGRYLAAMMSVPYFYIKTNKMVAAQRGELTPVGNETPVLRSRLVYMSEPPNLLQHPNDFHIRARYAIDRITPTSKSCLLITQDYEFDQQRAGDRCEPSGNLPCSRFYPRVSYQFIPREGEVLESLNVGQRLHYRPDGVAATTIALLHDCDAPGLPQVCGDSFVRRIFPGEGFDNRANPLIMETRSNVVMHGQDTHQWDNVHQTWNETVQEPNLQVGRLFGCPECVHTHWRWSSMLNYFFYAEFGSGLPITGDNNLRQTDQDVDIGLVRYKPGEEHPVHFTSILSRNESIRDLITRRTPTPPFRYHYQVLVPADVVFWYSATSHEPTADLFFKHGSFFNPELNAPHTAANFAVQGLSTPTQDGPIGVTFGRIYQTGTTDFAVVPGSSLPPLPTGFVFLGGQAHHITTTAAVSGPHVVSFAVPSVNDQTVFNNLRIFHLEEDPFDPDANIWVDQTILAPDPQAPNFANRTINARVNDLGDFAIGVMAQQPPDTGVADLAITLSDSPDPALADTNLTYSINIHNNGPQAALNARLLDTLATDVDLVSSSPSQGACKFHEGKVSCQLGTIASGGNASLSLVVRPLEERSGVPAGGKTIVNAVLVLSDNDDTNVNNNAAIETTVVLPNPNPAPQITITSPVTGTTYVGPPNLNVTAIATDSGGAIASVDFYDRETLLGSGVPAGPPNQFRIGWNPAFGHHTIVATATDSGGRVNTSEPVSILVNGFGSINITNPASGSIVQPLSNVTLSAHATNPPSPIAKVEFFANGIFVGPASLTGTDQYSIVWNSVPAGVYAVRASLTDNLGITTTSAPIQITASSGPTVTITSPADGASFSSNPTITINATATDNEGFVSSVNFFANGVLLGEAAQTGDTFSYLWERPADGLYSLTAEAVNDHGAKTVSNGIVVAINTTGVGPGEVIWFDNAPPQGAALFGNRDWWYWVDSNPAPFSGAKHHQSLIANGFHEHGFENAGFKLPINADDKIYTYVFLSPGFKPQELMLGFKDQNGSWEHRAYWTDRAVGNWVSNFGVDGTVSRRRMGPLPAEGSWVRLEIPAADVGLAGQTLTGMTFITYGGRAAFDRTGKTNRPTPTPPAPADVPYFDDALPQGAVEGNFNDTWRFITSNPAPMSGLKAHQSFIGTSGDNNKYRAHFFTGATQTMTVEPGDILYANVFMDPTFPPDQLVLGWHDGSNWHRAYWGPSWVLAGGRWGTEGMRYMGELPAANTWARLEVPAAYVGLEGKRVSGMYFGMNREAKHGLVTWDVTGKSTVPLSRTIAPLYATVPVHQFFDNNEGYSYFLSEKRRSSAPVLNKWYVHSDQAPGTEPVYRMKNATSGHYLLTRNPNVAGPGWAVDPNEGDAGIPFFVYPNAGTPETTPLHYYRGPKDYYYTIDPNDLAINGAHYEGVVGWVHPTRSVMSPQANLIDDATFFVQQHYRDFLSREPDTEGLNFWVTDYNTCAPFNLPCIENKRNHISAAFFLSIEFQQTGYFVYRYRKASFNVMPRRQQLYDDKAIVAQGLVVNAPGWETVLEANKVAFGEAWVQRPEFRAVFDSLSNAEYVDRLYANAAVPVDATTRNSLISALNAGTRTRASVLREVVETPAFVAKEYNAAFVLMEYFGYLQRNPDDPPDNDFRGFNFWLTKLNEHNGNYIDADMVKSFLISAEYRGRFGPPAGPSSAAALTVGSNVSAKAGNLAGKFNTVSTEGLMKVEGLYPWSVDQPPAGYTFFKNLAWKVTSTSNTSPPYTLTANIPWEVADAAEFAKLRIFNREGNAWVDRTILAPDSPAPDFNGRTLSARVNTLSTVIVAHEGDTQTSLSITSPSNGATFNAPASISINTSSYDPDGLIDKVQFYNGNELIGEDTSSPYQLSWTDINAGTYAITARALDNIGVNIASTTTVNVVVNAPPIVVITSPLGGTSLETPANIVFEAYASSSTGITKVEFFQGATKLGEDTTAPYTFNWNGVGVGSYNLTAKATNNVNLTATTTTTAISVVNTPPTVSITSPANGASLGNAPANVVITANAADSHGIKNVEFFKNGVSLGLDTTAPYSFSWNNLPVGTFSLTAKATDNLDAFTISTPVSVTVTNAAPSVAITAPAPNTAYTAPASITINATAADNEGISKVEFFQNGTKLGEDTTAPYSFTWANAGSGAYSLTAKATDGQNATTISSAVNVTVNAPPSITLTAPANGATYVAPAGVVLEASASDSDGAITQVEFFQNGASVGSDTTAPYSVSWAHVPFGSYSLTARATDDRGATVTSNVVNITVNPASTVLITSPNNNAVFIAGATVVFSANATDSDGISKVEFFQGSTKLGEDTSAPYSYDWTDVAAGDYSLTARATDTLGEITNSAVMNISVLPQVKQFVGWSAITNGLDLGNGTVRKTSTGTWDFSANSLQKLLPGDGYFESTAANYNQSIGLSGSDGSSRALVIGTGGWAAIYENGQEVAATCCRIPSETIAPHAAGDRYRIEITNSVLRYVRYRATVREVMFTSAAALPAYPISLGLGISPQDAEWQQTVLAQLTRKVTWSAIVNGVDLGNGSVRKTSTGTWDFSASAKQTLLRGDGYFESTASYWNHSINIGGSNGASNSLLLGTGGWAAIYENGQEVANTSPLGNITPHAAGDRYRLEIASGVLRYVRYRSGVRAVLYTSTNPLPAYPLSFSLGASFQNSEWQNTVIAQLSQTVSWSYINNGIDLGNGSVRKTSTGTWDFSAGPRQQLVYGNGYFESTASYWNHSINIGGSNNAGGSLLAGTGGWAAIYENGQEVANTSPLGNIAPHASGDRYRLEISRGKLRYVRYRGAARSVMFTSANALPAYAASYSLGASFQNSEWQNTVFSDNVPEHNDASFVSQSVPATMAPGQTYSVTVTMRNTGASTWTPDGDYQLASENQPDNQRWGLSRVNLSSIVLPGSDGTFTFTVTAPATGTHSFQWRMVQQGVERFGALSTNVNVQISGSAPAPSGENSTTPSGPTNAAPFVAITTPGSGASFGAPATIELEASAYDTDGVITEVEFFADGKILGIAKSAPFRLSWTSVPEGTYILTARAKDDGGRTTTSDSVIIVVNARASTKSPRRQQSVSKVQESGLLNRPFQKPALQTRLSARPQLHD